MATALLMGACARQPPRAEAAPSQPVARWAELDVARAWPSASAAFPSRGHGVGQYLIDVRVEPRYLGAYRNLSRGQTLPVGTTLAAFHRDRDTGAAASIYVMQKRSDAEWEFSVADDEGRLRPQQSVELCSRCHAEAPADDLFGVPRSPAAPATGMPPGEAPAEAQLLDSGSVAK